MTELFDNLVALLASEQSSRALADEFRIESPEAAGSAAELCAPVVLVNLNRVANDPTEISSLITALRSVETSGLMNPGLTIQAGLYEPFGSELVQTLLGSRREKVASVIAAGAGISERSAQWLLSPVAWAVMASIADRYGNQLAEQSLIAILRQENLDLLDGGWEPWLAATGDSTVAENTDEHLAIQSSAQMAGAERLEASGKYPPPVARAERSPSRPSDHQLDEPVDLAALAPPTENTTNGFPLDSSGGGSVSSDRSSDPLGERRSQQSDDFENHEQRFSDIERRGAKLPVVLSVAAAAIVGGLLWMFLFRNQAPDEESAVATADQSQESGESETSEADPLSAETDEAETGGNPETGTETAAEDTSDDTDANDSESQASTGEVVKIDLMMTDTLGRTDATAIAEIRLDAEAGEICYNVTSEGLSSPYDTHIHFGKASEKGPIVVDFGSLESGDIGCITVAATDMAAITQNRVGHYYELHEPDSEITVRAQLDDAMEDPNVTSNNKFDPRGGGARAVIETGKITLKGDVADQATVDWLIQEYSTVDLTQTELVDELRIVADSPAPSGLIEVDDEILFEVASSELGSVEGTVIEDLANLFRARPDWTMAVVGHTDNTGNPVDNLELSLERADAVRDALIELGVDADNLRTQGAGDTEPIFSNESASGQSRNRRIEFKVDPPQR